MLYINKNTRIFVLDQGWGGHIRYVHNAAVFRVLIADGYARVLIRQPLDDGNFGGISVKEIRDGQDVRVLYAEMVDPSHYNPSEIIMSFNDCKVKRRWYQDVGTIHPSGVAPIMSWIELWSLHWEIET